MLACIFKVRHGCQRFVLQRLIARAPIGQIQPQEHSCSGRNAIVNRRCYGPGSEASVARLNRNVKSRVCSWKCMLRQFPKWASGAGTSSCLDQSRGAEFRAVARTKEAASGSTRRTIVEAFALSGGKHAGSRIAFSGERRPMALSGTLRSATRIETPNRRRGKADQSHAG